MRILLALKQRNYLTTFTGVVDELLRRGHAVRLAWPDDELPIPVQLEWPGAATGPVALRWEVPAAP